MGILRRREMMVQQSSDPNLIFEARNIVLTGSNFVDTGFNAFSAENINKDFKITIRMSEMIWVNGSATIIGNKYEGSIGGKSYPGFYFRYMNGASGTNKCQVSTSSSVGYNINNADVVNKNLYIWREGTDKLYSYYDGISTKTMNLNSAVFNQNMMIGCAIQANGVKFRYAKGTIEYIRIEYI